MPVVKQWLQSHQAPKEAAQLQVQQAYHGDLTNVQETARQVLHIENTEIVMWPMSGGSEPPEAA